MLPFDRSLSALYRTHQHESSSRPTNLTHGLIWPSNTPRSARAKALISFVSRGTPQTLATGNTLFSKYHALIPRC